MGHWDYRNIGASTTTENKKHVEKIFEYIGYAPDPDYAPDGEECSFNYPDVYCCEYSAYDEASGNIKEYFEDMGEIDLLNLLNALFPQTDVYVHAAEGNNTSDTWENHDTVYDTEDMTCYSDDSYTSYDCGANGKRSSKARFVLKPPKMEYINALIDLSNADGNTELTNLLLDLSQKLKDSLIVYEDDLSDKREIGKEYDIEDNVEGDNYEDDEYYDDEYEEDEEDYEEDEFSNE